MLEMPAVRSRWLDKFGREPNDQDVDRMYDKFVPKNIEALEKHADVITNVPQTVEELRERGIKIGSCTGFVRPILDKLMVCCLVHSRTMTPINASNPTNASYLLYNA